jgi:hypothetical protein
MTEHSNFKYSVGDIVIHNGTPLQVTARAMVNHGVVGPAYLLHQGSLWIDERELTVPAPQFDRDQLSRLTTIPLSELPEPVATTITAITIGIVDALSLMGCYKVHSRTVEQYFLAAAVVEGWDTRDQVICASSVFVDTIVRALVMETGTEIPPTCPF